MGLLIKVFKARGTQGSSFSASFYFSSCLFLFIFLFPSQQTRSHMKNKRCLLYAA